MLNYDSKSYSESFDSNFLSAQASFLTLSQIPKYL